MKNDKKWLFLLQLLLVVIGLMGTSMMQTTSKIGDVKSVAQGEPETQVSCQEGGFVWHSVPC